VVITGRRFGFGVLTLAFVLGSFNTIQLLPTMNGIEYCQEGYFNISKSDRSRSIWDEEPVVFYEGRPNHRVRSENPNNVSSQELRAWQQVLWDYHGYLKEMGIQWCGLGTSPLNGTVVYYMCDLTEEKVELFVDTMKYYVPMGVVVLVNACVVGVGFEPLKSETTFNVIIGLNKYVFDSKDTAKLVIRNRDSHQITYGSDYIIQKLVDGEWVKVSLFPPRGAFTAIALSLPAGRTTTQEIKIDTLEPGHYRVHKKVDIEGGEVTFILEFDIRGEG